MKKFLLIIGIIFSFVGCKTQYIPIETGTTVHIIDSTAIHYLDSIRIYEATRYREMGWLTDTLKVKTERGTEVTVFADTTKELLTADIKEPPLEEKTKYIYKDKIVFKDSLVYKEKPVPVEKRVEVKYVPWYHKTLSAVGLISILIVLSLLGIKIYKLRGKGIKEIIKTLL